jgi:hypothetical protein
MNAAILCSGSIIGSQTKWGVLPRLGDRTSRATPPEQGSDARFSNARERGLLALRMLVAGCPPRSGSRASPRRDEFALAIVPRKRVDQARYHRREPDDERNQGDQPLWELHCDGQHRRHYDKRGLPDPLVLAFYFTAQSDLIVQLIIRRNRFDI